MQALVDDSDPPTILLHLAGLPLKVSGSEVDVWAMPLAAQTPCHDRGAIDDQMDSDLREALVLLPNVSSDDR